MVVGAGHNGLVAAIRLAAAGLDVCVLEQAPRAGGGLSSGQETLPGFVHDICSAFFPQAVASPVFRALPLARLGVEWIDPPVAMAHPFLDGSAIALHRDLEATAAGLDAVAPGAGARWAGLVRRLEPHREALFATALAPLVAVRPALRLALGLRARGAVLGLGALGPATRFARRLFRDPRAAAWLCGSASHSDLSPTEPVSGAIAFGLTYLGQVVGWPYPRGGAGRLTDALVSHLRELGGEVRCGARLEAIEVAGGRVAGVRLAGGERMSAGVVIATAGVAQLLAMVPAGALGARVERRLGHWRYGLGTFKLDLALSAPAPWTAPQAREAGVVHVGDDLAALVRAPREAAAGRMPREPVMVVGQHTLHDPSRAPAGRHTLYVYARVPKHPPPPDDEIAEIMLARLEQFAPGLGGLILGRRLRSPRTIEAENPALGGGDLAAGSMRLGQVLLLRPDPALCRGRTPLPGLYVAGGWVHPGPGVHGVSGDGAARAALAELAPRRRR